MNGEKTNSVLAVLFGVSKRDYDYDYDNDYGDKYIRIGYVLCSTRMYRRRIGNLAHDVRVRVGERRRRSYRIRVHVTN